jgi:protein-tyrosine-phosphatase/isopentenyldiphosphate isomerase
MLIHFVCSGNSFRSRLAEAYAKSLHIPGLQFISSGTHSYMDPYNHLSPQCKLVLNHKKLTTYASKEKTQLTQELIDKSDLVVCINRAVYHEALAENIKFPPRTYIWDINDISEFTQEEQLQIANQQVPLRVQKIFEHIQQHIEELIVFLKRPRPTEQVEILNKSGRPTGKSSDITTIHENGWWHTGVHIGLYTSNGEVLLERRSKNIIGNPGMWDISMGGIVKKGELPDSAILRELKEELGINLHSSDLKKIFVWCYDHYLPSYGFHNRNFTHTYIAKIPSNIRLLLQRDEVASAEFMSIKNVQHLNIRNHMAIHRVIPTFAYYNRILDAIRAEL